MIDKNTATAEAEQALVGAVLVDNSVWWKVLGRVTADDFKTPLCAELWVAIGEMIEAGEAADAVTVGEKVNAIGDAVGTVQRIVQQVASTANAETYADIVSGKSRLRKAVAVIANGMAGIQRGELEALTELQSQLESLNNKTFGESMTFAQALVQASIQIDAAAKLSDGETVGFPTGLPAIDHKTGGLREGQLWVLCARPSLGKTALALQIALHGAKHGYTTGFASLEMGAGELAIRSIAHEFRVNVSRLAMGRASETAKVADQVRDGKTIQTYPLFIDDATYTTDGIIARAAEWRNRHKIDLLIVDHLQLVEQAGENRNIAVGEVTRRLKKTAKRLGIPVLVLCQLNRELERAHRVPQLSDLRDSGNIEQDADVVLAIHGELNAENQGNSDYRDIQLGLLKNRNGRVGWCAEKFYFFGPEQRIGEASHGDRQGG